MRSSLAITPTLVAAMPGGAAAPANLIAADCPAELARVLTDCEAAYLGGGAALSELFVEPQMHCVTSPV